MKKWAPVFMVVFFCMCIVVRAQEVETAESQNAVPVVTPGNEYITEWLVVGPFFPRNLETDFLASVGGEESMRPKAGDTVIMQDGKTLAWKRYNSETDIVDLRNAVGEHEDATAYAFCILRSEDVLASKIYLGSDDGVAVWINGRQIWRRDVGRAFRLDEDIFQTDLKRGENRCLIKVSQYVELWQFSIRVDTSPPNYAVLSGVVSDGSGRPVSQVYVRLEQDGRDVAWTLTDESGSYRMDIYPASGQYDLYADMDKRGDLRSGISLTQGQSRKFNLTLENAVNIEGKLLMLDGKTPHAAVIVQAIMTGGGRPVSALSDANGAYQITNLKAGSYRVRCYTPDGYIYYKRGANNASGASDATTLWMEPGRTTGNIDFRFAPFKKGTWRNYSQMDGLVNDEVLAIYRDRDGTIWIGTGNGVSRYDGKEFVNLTQKDGLVDKRIDDIYRDPDGVIFFGSFGKGSQFDSQMFTSFSTQRGLAYNILTSIHRDPDGAMWFGSESGVFQYDGTDFINFSEADGLSASMVSAVQSAPDGVMWFGTDKGVSCYDPNSILNFTEKDGLTHNSVRSIYRNPDGVMWFGTEGSGVFSYDGRSFVNLTTADGLTNNSVHAVSRDPDGVMWFGTEGSGVFSYDGRSFVNLTTTNGLAGDSVHTISRGADGAMWFGTSGGVSRYDGKGFVNFTTRNGLPYDEVLAIYSAPDNMTWIATCDPSGARGGVSIYNGEKIADFSTGAGLADNKISFIYNDPDNVKWFGSEHGVFRYDVKGIVNLTTADGLANNSVRNVCRDEDGVLWFATCGGGISGYDGAAWTSLDTRDGLAGNCVYSICSDPERGLWLGTDNGSMLYHRSAELPGVRIVSVKGAGQTYKDTSAVKDIPVNTRVTIAYSAIDFRTMPENRQYQHRVKEMNSDWSKPTKASAFDVTFKDTGSYKFEVRAINRDLRYSNPASVAITVSAMPFYRTGIFLLALSIAGGGALIILLITALRRRSLSHSKKLRLQQELDNAHKIQLGLLPKTAPFVSGFDIAGLCQPAREVGGDFFDYIPLMNRNMGVAIASSSEKGLKAAESASLTRQTLHELAQNSASSCGELLSALNSRLYSQIEKQKYVTLGFAILRPNGGMLQWSNAGQPHPIVKRGQQIFEVRGSNAPLGMMQSSVYSDQDPDVQAGDIVIFYTEGVVEAKNKDQKIYGVEQLRQVVKDINPITDAKGILLAVLQSVKNFIGKTEQHDDITIVVLKKALRAS